MDRHCGSHLSLCSRRPSPCYHAHHAHHLHRFGHPDIREEGLSWQVEIGAQLEAVTLTDPTPSPSTEGHEPARLASPADVTAVAPVVREYMVGLEVIAIEHSMPADSVVVQAGVPGGRRARRAVRGRQAAVVA